MKSFRSLVVLKRPHGVLWTNMRDHLPELAKDIADIKEIRQVDRTADADGVVHIVNRWSVHQQIPAMIRPILKTDELAWVDRNEWDERSLSCDWAIEPCFLGEFITCRGRTGFAPAMAGQGARVTFEGALELKPGVLGGAMGGIEKLLSGFLESIVTTVIPRNLRGVVEAAAAFQSRSTDQDAMMKAQTGISHR